METSQSEPRRLVTTGMKSQLTDFWEHRRKLLIISNILKKIFYICCFCTITAFCTRPQAMSVSSFSSLLDFFTYHLVTVNGFGVLALVFFSYGICTDGVITVAILFAQGQVRRAMTGMGLTSWSRKPFESSWPSWEHFY